MRVSQLTLKVAEEIMSCGVLELYDFIKNHEYFHHIDFTHRNFYYSHPKFGYKWPDHFRSCCFHTIETFCHECGAQPERNYAGYGTMYITGFDPRIEGRLTIYCSKCVPGRRFKMHKTKQLLLF